MITGAARCQEVPLSTFILLPSSGIERLLEHLKVPLLLRVRYGGEWSALGSRDIDHTTRRARVSEQEANESIGRSVLEHAASTEITPGLLRFDDEVLYLSWIFKAVTRLCS